MTFSSASVFINDARAGCDLKGCSLKEHQNNDPGNFLGLVTATTLLGAFEIEQQNTSYIVTSLYSDLYPTPWLRFALEVPFASLSVPGKNYFGMTNVVLDSAAAPWFSEDGRSMLWVGNQVEFPTGDQHKFLGSGHFEILPYSAFHWTTGTLVSYVQVGGRIALRSEDQHDLTGATSEHEAGEFDFHGSVVDPHARTEWLYRAGVHRRFWEKLSAGLSISGLTVLSNDDKGATFAFFIPEVSYKPIQSMAIRISGDVPFTPDRRFDWRTSLGITYLF